QAVALGEVDRTVDDRTIYWEQYKVFSTILQEATQDAVALLLGDAARRSRFCRQSRRHFGKGDFGEQDRVLRLRISNLPYPRAARFIGVALHQGAGVHVVLGHGFAPGASEMISMGEGPAVCGRMVRTSSSVTPGIILPRSVGLSARMRPVACKTSRAVRGRAASHAWSAVSSHSRPRASGA